MRRAIIFLSILISITILVKLFQTTKNHPLSKETVRDIFGADIEYKLKSKHDLGGYSIHGDQFILYEYDVSMKQLKHLIDQDILKKYPAFKSGRFENIILADSNFAVRWKQMPIQTKIDSLIYQSTFSFFEVKTLEIDGTKIEDKNLLNSSNFYCCINATPIGNYFFILDPKSGTLYLVNKSG